MGDLKKWGILVMGGGGGGGFGNGGGGGRIEIPLRNMILGFSI